MQFISNRILVLLFSLFMIFPLSAKSETSQQIQEKANNRADILSTFTGSQRGALIESYDERRDQHRILFYMGAALLLFVLLTAGFGISMAMLGKDVFVPHMICAGVTVFLSIAHAVVAVVWFFPF